MCGLSSTCRKTLGGNLRAGKLVVGLTPPPCLVGVFLVEVLLFFSDFDAALDLFKSVFPTLADELPVVIIKQNINKNVFLIINY